MFRLSYREVSIILFLFFHVALAERQCNTTDLVGMGCSETESCIATSNISHTGFCNCLIGYKRVNETQCKLISTLKSPTQPSSSSLVDDANKSHLVAAITIPLFVIALVICGICIGHKYNFYAWVRNKIYQRNHNYDEVMIGQDLDDDDPPLH